MSCYWLLSVTAVCGGQVLLDCQVCPNAATVMSPAVNKRCFVSNKVCSTDRCVMLSGTAIGFVSHTV